MASTLSNAQPATTTIGIGNKQQLLMESLTNFFMKGTSILSFLDSIKPDSEVSLRTIDWFVTNFSREFDVSYCHPQTQRPFIVHDAYKSQLKAYSKRQFDPFCRRTRINFYYSKGKKVVTTVGQLNFFRWAIDNNVLQYISLHQDQIEEHMKKRVKKSRQNTKTCKNNKGGGEGVHGASTGGAAVEVDGGGGGGGGGGSGGVTAGKTKRKSAASSTRRTISKHKVEMTVYFQ